MSTDNDITFNIPVPNCNQSDWGYEDANRVRHSYATVLVTADDCVLARAPGGDTLSPCHTLTDAQVAEVRRLAALVRSGSHIVVGGLVYDAAEWRERARRQAANMSGGAL